MYYIDAVKLVELAVEHGALTQYTQVDPETGTEFTGIVVYRENESLPELWEKEYMAMRLIDDAKGEQALIEALSERGIKFVRYEGSPSDEALSAACEALSHSEHM